MELGRIPVYDFFNAFSDRREYFRDATHLNSKGAEAFTDMINDAVLG